MICKICNTEFTPSKYRPQQKVCSQPACQKARQLQNIRAWRSRNPDYFKCLGQASVWRENRHRYSKRWKINHPEYQKKYGEAHKTDRRKYMREYMRVHRSGPKSVNRDKS